MIFFIFLLSISFSAFEPVYTSPGYNLTNLTTSPGMIYPSGFLKDLANNWQGIAAVLLATMLILAAIGQAIGKSLNLPRLVAWSTLEIGEIITTLLIYIALLVFFPAFDYFLSDWLNSDPNWAGLCTGKQWCAFEVAEAYLTGFIELSEEKVKEYAREAMQLYYEASRGQVFGCTDMFTLCIMQFAYQSMLSPQERFKAETYAQFIKYHMEILQNVYSHYYALQIVRVLAPALLVLGFVFRAFFATRRFGALLIAIALALFFAYPATYMLASMMLRISTGSYAMPPANPSHGFCPNVCRKQPPLAFYKQGTEIIQIDSPTLIQLLKSDPYYSGNLTRLADAYNSLMNGSKENIIINVNDTSIRVVSCVYYDVQYGCEQLCRYLPYPSFNPFCNNETKWKACANLWKNAPEEVREGCFHITSIHPAYSLDDIDLYLEVETKCPKKCRGVPSLTPYNEWNPNNYSITHQCRYTFSNSNFTEQKEGYEKVPLGCDRYHRTVVNYTLESQKTDPWKAFLFIFKDIGANCSVLCGGCPDYCRVLIPNTTPKDWWRKENASFYFSGRIEKEDENVSFYFYLDIENFTWNGSLYYNYNWSGEENEIYEVDAYVYDENDEMLGLLSGNLTVWSGNGEKDSGGGRWRIEGEFIPPSRLIEKNESGWNVTYNEGAWEVTTGNERLERSNWTLNGSFVFAGSIYDSILHPMLSGSGTMSYDGEEREIVVEYADAYFYNISSSIPAHEEFFFIPCDIPACQECFNDFSDCFIDTSDEEQLWEYFKVKLNDNLSPCLPSEAERDNTRRCGGIDYTCRINKSAPGCDPNKVTLYCKEECRDVDLPPSSLACFGCRDLPHVGYLFDPPVVIDCSMVCELPRKGEFFMSTSPIQGWQELASAELRGIDLGTGAIDVSVEPITDIARRMLIIKLLPFFGIAFVATFAIELSKVLGGEIELPGIGKII